ncbi:MAG: hypothetical protein K0S46_2030 [Moraxellaceae bacterium]|jgi:hypothetical protein|nr:hypothetical protein [Moraxellaceae bacterium]
MLNKIIAATFAAALSATAMAESAYDKPGFYTQVEDGRLWVFQEGSKELEQFKAHGEPAVNVSRIGEGPEGMTLKAPSQAVLDAWLSTK